MKILKIISIVLIVWAVVIVGAHIYSTYFNRTPTGLLQRPALQISGNTADLLAISIVPGEVITEGKVITGTLKGGYFFETQARVEILDVGKNIQTTFPIKATSDWMADAVNFSFPVSYAVDDIPIRKGAGFLRIENDNPSGDMSKNKHIDIPVVFQ